MPSKGATSASELLKQMDGTIGTVRKEVDEKSQYLQSLVTARDALAAGVLRNAVRNSGGGNGRKTRRTGGNLTQSIRTVLANAPFPVTVNEIMAELQKHGIQGETPTVRSTLTSLKKRGLVKNPDYGKWVGISEEGSAQAAA